MKSKLLLFILITAVMLFLVALPAMASEDYIEITRPEGNEEVVTKEVFSIWGKCIYDETTITFEYLDQETGNYEPLLTTGGVSTFKVGKSKTFGKDIKLKYKGPNEIKIKAYTAGNEDDPQELYYTITRGDKQSGSLEAIVEWFNKFKDSDKAENENKP